MSSCHTVKFYWDETDLSATLADVTSDALEQDENVQAIIDRDQWAHFRNRSSSRRTAVDEAIDTGHLEFVPVSKIRRQLTDDGPPTPERFDEVVGSRIRDRLEEWSSVHIFTQLVDVMLRDGDYEAAERVEKITGQRCGDQLRVTCSFDLETFDDPADAQQFQYLVDLHHEILPAGDELDAQHVADTQRQTVTLSEQVRRHLRNEEQLGEVVDHHRQLSRRKDEFLAMLAHELRNPMAAIVHAVDLMELLGVKGGERERGIVKRQVTHMQRLVDDLLDVSRLTRGDLELDRQQVDLTDAVDRAVEMSRPTIDKFDQHLVVSIPDSSPPVDGDFDRLIQVISNLLTNAAEYNDPGIRIWVDLEANRQAVILRVRDDGRGLREETLDQIFDLFHQTDAIADSSVGIGLPLAHRLVELHGGTLRAHSDGPGEGSEFVVELPRADATGDQPPPGDDEARPSSTATRILLVDDNRDLADTLAELLEHFGHDVRVAYDPHSALELVDSFAPDLALLDLNLPDISGFELAERLAAPPAPARPDHIVALSGYGDEATQQRGREAGFDDHLVKPVTPDQLQELVEGL